MNAERRRVVELKWWLSSLATLLAVLLVTKVLASGGPLAPVETSGGTGSLVERFGVEFLWPIWIVIVFLPFVVVSSLGFRLIVPRIRSAPPREVGVAVAAWPLVFGAAVLSGDPIALALFGAVGIGWGIAMPLPGKTLLSSRPLFGSAMIGLACAAFAPWEGLLAAIAWCLWRMRTNPDQAAAAAASAAVLPGVYLALAMPGAIDPGSAAEYLLEVLILAGIFVAAVILRRLGIFGAPVDDGEVDATAEPVQV